MNIYKVFRTDKIRYDEYIAFVCYAENKSKAICMEPSSDGWGDCEAIEVTIACDFLGEAPHVKKSGMILISFMAG